jgi:uncharacterized protein (DUF2141 family)
MEVSVRARRVLVLFVVLLVAAGSVTVNAGKIIVTVKGITPEKGKLSLGLYDDKGFPEPGEEVEGAKLKVEGPELTHVFEGLTPGNYAVSLFHDRNGNGKLDKNFLGIPREGYGFSNDEFNWYGAAPDFSKASVELEQDETLELTIDVKSWPPQV